MKYTEETAVVRGVKGGHISVETENAGGCGSCSTKLGCGSVSSIFTPRSKNIITLKSSLQVKEGDSVIVAIASDKLLFATVIMYVFPLLLLFLFSVVAKIFLGEIASIVAGLLGLFIGLISVKIYSKKDKVSSQFQPQLIRKVINIEAI